MLRQLSMALMAFRPKLCLALPGGTWHGGVPVGAASESGRPGDRLRARSCLSMEDYGQWRERSCVQKERHTRATTTLL